jgi:hypothetical protein
MAQCDWFYPSDGKQRVCPPELEYGNW